MSRNIAVVGVVAPAWLEILQSQLSPHRVERAEAFAPEAVDYVIGWAPPPHAFEGFTTLRAVFVLGAGVDRFINRADLDPTIPLIRLTDAGLTAQMIEYALYGVLRHQRHMDIYEQQQLSGLWHALSPRLPSEMTVGVLGLGEMGGAVARVLAERGYGVIGWSRSERTIGGVRCLHGETGLLTLLAASEVLINLLPSTPQTRGILNAERLATLPKGASVINAGRGDHLHTGALRGLLDNGHLRGAMLDVFPREPLPDNSPLWGHPKVTITPHVAAETLPLPAARQIADKIAAREAGREVAGLVNPQRGY